MREQQQLPPQPSHKNSVKYAENMGFSMVFDPMGRNESAFRPVRFTIANEIRGFEHISYGIAVNCHDENASVCRMWVIVLNEH